MKKILDLLFCFFIGFSLYSCGNKNQKEIIGKWSGERIEKAGNNIITQIYQEIEFNDNGQIIKTDNPENSNLIIYQYNMKDDFIIWLNNGKSIGLNSHIDFLSKTTLVYTSSFENITWTTTLKRIKN